MTKPLTDTQRVTLANAATRSDARIFPVPSTLKKNSGAITLSLRPLVTAGLIAEMPAEKSDAKWGQTGEGVPTTLAITEQGLTAIGVEPEADGHPEAPPLNSADLKRPSPSSKLGIVTACLGRMDGATIDELVAATGWQKHSVRGAISGALKTKHKLTVQSEVVEGKGRVYRIAGAKVTEVASVGLVAATTPGIETQS